MKNPRTYGSSPYKIAVIHGGPGAPGYMKPVAKELSKITGILEPLQTKDSINGQVEELYTILMEYSQLPVTLIAHSWGGFLSIVLCDKFPEVIERLVLIGTGPFEEKYVRKIKEIRSSRFSQKEIEEAQKIAKRLYDKDAPDKLKLLEKLGNLSSRTDSFDPLPSNSYVIKYQPEVHNKVWTEAVKLRKEGKFLEMIKKINIPVIVIHGVYDPHPYEAVKEPFSKFVKDFKFFLLEKCGHYPWMEKYAKDKFYEIIQKIINSTI